MRIQHADTPTGHWKFDESSANHVPEFAAPVTLTGPVYSPDAPVITGIPNSSALVFDGVDDHASIDHTTGVTDVGDADFSVSVWVKASRGGSNSGHAR